MKLTAKVTIHEKKMANRTIEEVYESMEESRMDRLLGQSHDVVQENDLLENLDEPDDSDVEDGRAVEGKLDKKTSRPKTKRMPRRKR